jgi:single-strand DNA-binding protein
LVAYIFIEGSLAMNNLNSVLIEGNLVRDPEYSTTPKGTAVCKFPIASNRFYRQDDALEKEVGFFDVDSWGKLAERANEIGRKGKGVRVVGRLKQDRWQSKDGKAMSKVSIVAEHIEFRADFKKDDSSTDYKAEETEAEEYTEEENLVPSF